MNEIRISEETRKQYKAHLLTDRPNEWNKECWGDRKVIELENKGSFNHEGTTYNLIQGTARINGCDWIVTAKYENFCNETPVFWAHSPITSS